MGADESLIINNVIKAEDGVDAFLDLVRLHEKRVYLLARSYCGRHADAEDLSQEVWLKVYQSLHLFRGDCSFFTWVRQILVNTFLNWKRKLHVEESLDEQQYQPAVFDNHEQRILLRAIKETLRDFPARQRLIVLLKYQEDLTHEEIAQLLGCSSGTVKKALFRAIEKLRETFDPERGG